MSIERVNIKSRSKEQLKGRWGLIIGTLLLGTILMNLGNTIYSSILYNRLANANSINEIFEVSNTLSKSGYNAISVLWSLLLSGVFQFGINRFLLNFTDNTRDPKIQDLFSGFNVIFKTIGITVLQGLIITLGFILLIIPGIIFSFMYSQTFYILAEDNSKSVMECLKESRNMMKGHKFEMFILMLSFIGWILLSAVTLGIALLWVKPYMSTTYCNYYNELRREYYINQQEA